MANGFSLESVPALVLTGATGYRMLESMNSAKGVVVVGRVSYRVSKLHAGKYEVVRILDDRRVGTFENEPRLVVEPEGIEPELLREIAIAGLKQAKISWSQRLPRI